MATGFLLHGLKSSKGLILGGLPAINTSALTTATLPDYQFAWAPLGTAYWINDTAPVEWVLTRADGLLVPLPVQATLTIKRPDRNVDSISLGNIFGNSSVPIASLTVGADYTFTMAGIYVAILTLTLNTGSGPVQTRSVRQTVTIMR